MDLPQYCINRTIHLQVPTNDLQELVSTAVRALRMDFRKEGGYQYKKAGVIVWNIVPDSAIQTNLFDTIDRDKQSRLAAAIDAINRKVSLFKRESKLSESEFWAAIGWLSKEDKLSFSTEKVGKKTVKTYSLKD